MGCCCSLSVTEIQDVSPQKNTRNRPLHKSVPLPPDYQIQKKPFKKTQLNWIADQPMTPSELKQKRDVYWETAVEYSVRQPVLYQHHLFISFSLGTQRNMASVTSGFFRIRCLGCSIYLRCCQYHLAYG